MLPKGYLTVLDLCIYFKLMKQDVLYIVIEHMCVICGLMIIE
ncbi:hypothetical protein Q3304_17615 [Clostridioides sp. GD02377]